MHANLLSGKVFLLTHRLIFTYCLSYLRANRLKFTTVFLKKNTFLMCHECCYLWVLLLSFYYKDKSESSSNTHYVNIWNKMILGESNTSLINWQVIKYVQHLPYTKHATGKTQLVRPSLSKLLCLCSRSI